MSAHNVNPGSSVMRTSYTYTHMLEANSLEDATAHVDAVFRATGWSPHGTNNIEDHMKLMGISPELPTRMLGYGQAGPIRRAIMGEPAFAMLLPMSVAVIETEFNKMYEVAGIRPLSLNKMMEKADKAFEALAELDSEMAATMDAIGKHTSSHGEGATEGMKDIHAKEPVKHIADSSKGESMKGSKGASSETKAKKGGSDTKMKGAGSETKSKGAGSDTKMKGAGSETKTRSKTKKQAAAASGSAMEQDTQ
jgi:hypothetical protein